MPRPPGFYAFETALLTFLATRQKLDIDDHPETWQAPDATKRLIRRHFDCCRHYACHVAASDSSGKHTSCSDAFPRHFNGSALSDARMLIPRYCEGGKTSDPFAFLKRQMPSQDGNLAINAFDGDLRYDTERETAHGHLYATLTLSLDYTVSPLQSLPKGIAIMHQNESTSKTDNCYHTSQGNAPILMQVATFRECHEDMKGRSNQTSAQDNHGQKEVDTNMAGSNESWKKEKHKRTKTVPTSHSHFDTFTKASDGKYKTSKHCRLEEETERAVAVGPNGWTERGGHGRKEQ
uniref:Uncharacterized protein n=1 Tax=Panagrellus redivivus TaxID=6233 RepID=A0A7E4UPV6_PANRE